MTVQWGFLLFIHLIIGDAFSLYETLSKLYLCIRSCYCYPDLMIFAFYLGRSVIKVDTFFAVGSPLGVFLALRNIRIGIGKHLSVSFVPNLI